MRLNGKRSQKEILSFAASWAGYSEKNSKRPPAVELLSKIAGTELENYICQHTTLPLRRSITANLYDSPHADECCRGLLLHYGMRTTRSGAYFCPDCTQDDLDTHGISYWHRKLQMPGLLWCPKHHTPLRYVDAEESFLSSPHTFMASAKSIDEHWVRKFQRFIDISFALMERKVPLYSKAIAQAFKKRVIYKKTRNPGGTLKSLLFSDLVVDTFDPEWLALTFPVIEHKARGERMYQLDGIFYGKKAAPTAFILAAVVLFETVDEALDTMLASHMELKQKPAYDCRGARLDDDELKAAYLRCGGDHATVAEEVQRQRVSVTARLNILGFPHLATHNGVAQDFIEAFLVDRRPLSESKAASGIDEQGMERVLRTLSGTFANVMKKMTTVKGTKNRKAKSRVPHEINQKSVVI